MDDFDDMRKRVEFDAESGSSSKTSIVGAHGLEAQDAESTGRGRRCREEAEGRRAAIPSSSRPSGVPRRVSAISSVSWNELGPTFR